eukprot:g450.t1
MSPKQMGIEQERLAGREQGLMQEAERTRQELQLEQLRLQAELEENLLKVLEEIQDEMNYDYILSKAPGSGLLMVNDANDITAEVVKRINLIPIDESNYGMTKQLLFNHVDLPEENIHRVIGEADPTAEAIRYSAEISDNTEASEGYPVFDLVILGMGSDGHTASIFPHQMDLLKSEKFCAVADHPESGQQRITLTGPVINRAKAVAFLVTGESKQEKVSAILGREEGATQFPAAHIMPQSGDLHWFMDEAAYSE